MFDQECNDIYITLVLFNTQTAINLLFHCSFLCDVSVAPESRCGTFTPSGISVYLSKLIFNCTRFGDRGSTVVKVLHYKSEGRWFDPSWY